MEVALGMPFLTLASADLRFAEKELVWGSYTVAEVPWEKEKKTAHGSKSKSLCGSILVDDRI